MLEKFVVLKVVSQIVFGLALFLNKEHCSNPVDVVFRSISYNVEIVYMSTNVIIAFSIRAGAHPYIPIVS